MIKKIGASALALLFANSGSADEIASCEKLMEAESGSPITVCGSAKNINEAIARAVVTKPRKWAPYRVPPRLFTVKVPGIVPGTEGVGEPCLRYGVGVL